MRILELAEEESLIDILEKEKLFSLSVTSTNDNIKMKFPPRPLVTKMILSLHQRFQ